MWNTIKINILAFPVDLHSSTPLHLWHWHWHLAGCNLLLKMDIEKTLTWLHQKDDIGHVWSCIKERGLLLSATCWVAHSSCGAPVRQKGARAKSPNLSTYEAGMGTQMLLLLLPTSQPQIVLSVHKTSQIWRGHRLLPKVWLVLNWSPATGNGSVDWLWWWATKYFPSPFFYYFFMAAIIKRSLVIFFK